MKVTFNQPNTKVGVAIKTIPAGMHRNPYVMEFLDEFHEEIQLRMGSTAVWPEESYLVLVNGSCHKCRKQLYHIPKSAINDTSTSAEEAQG